MVAFYIASSRVYPKSFAVFMRDVTALLLPFLTSSPVGPRYLLAFESSIDLSRAQQAMYAAISAELRVIFSLLRIL